MALIVVLASLGLLAGLFLAFAGRTADHARLTGNLRLQQEARALAESGLVLAATELLAQALNRENPEARVPVDGSWRSCELHGGRLSLSLQDVAGRVDLNAASPELLRLVVEGVAPGEEGRRLLAAIEAARQAASTQGRQAFRGVEELAGLGASPELLAALEPLLTTWFSIDGVSPEAARPELKRLLERAILSPSARRDLSWRTYLVEVVAETASSGRVRLLATLSLEPGGRPSYNVSEERWSQGLLLATGKGLVVNK